MWDCRSEKHSGKQADVLSHVFGEAVLGYFEEATRTSDREDRSQLFQLSCCDRRIVDAHLDNEIVLLGRGKTAFKSACLAPVPIWPERIGKVHSATEENYPFEAMPWWQYNTQLGPKLMGDALPSVSLDDFYRGKI
jgi:hypothetical protein